MTLTDPGDVCVRTAGPAGHVRIGAEEPPSAGLIARLTAACDAVEDRAGGVLVLEMGGPGGTEGLSPAASTALDIQLISRWENALRRVERLPAVVVAVVRGACGGAGVEALLTADHRIAASDASLRLPGGPDGAWPGTLLHRLANQVGAARTRRLALCTGPLSAAAAVDAGLLDEVHDDVDSAVTAALDRLGGVPAAEWAVRRGLILEAGTRFEDALGAHLAACDRALRRARDRADGQAPR